MIMPVVKKDLKALVKGGLIIFGGRQVNSSKMNSPDEPPSTQLEPATKEQWEEFERNEKVLGEALKKHKPPIPFG